MNYILDSYVEIGNTHNICQDYVLHGTVGEIPFIAVSDGCSSSKFTDIGSRLLTLSFKRALVDFANLPMTNQMTEREIFDFIHSRLLFRLQYNLESLALKSSVADATMLFAFVFDNRLFTKMYGDGHVVYRHVNGQQEQIQRHYSGNNPYYISYQLDYLRNKAYDPSTELTQTVTKFPDVSEHTHNKVPYNAPYEEVRPISEIQSISLFSDGIESYSISPKSPDYSTTIGKSSTIETSIYWVCEMTSYKNCNGEYVKRRMKRIAMDNTKNHIEHHDDVSVATLWVNHEQQ